MKYMYCIYDHLQVASYNEPVRAPFNLNQKLHWDRSANELDDEIHLRSPRSIDSIESQIQERGKS